MFNLQPTDDGIRLPVLAQPGHRRNGITGVHDGRLKVAVTQAPEHGKANKELTRVIATAFGLKRSQVTLRAGAHSSRKVFVVTGVSVDELQRRLQSILGEIA